MGDMGRRETKVVEEAEKGGCLHIRKRRADSKGAFVLPFTGDLERDSHGGGVYVVGGGFWSGTGKGGEMCRETPAVALQTPYRLPGVRKLVLKCPQRTAGS